MTYRFHMVFNNGRARDVYDHFNSEWAARETWFARDGFVVLCGDAAYARLTCVETGEVIVERGTI